MYSRKKAILLLILGGLLVRLFVLQVSFVIHGISGHTGDILAFQAWAGMLFGGGLRAFYGTDAFTDYTPGYMYVLYVVGALRSLFGLEFGSFGHNLLVKMPAMLADIGIGLVLYFFATKRYKKIQNTSLTPFTIAALYVFNPLSIMLSAVWGQVESVYALPMLLSLYMLSEKRDMEAYLLYAVAILVKPLALMFGPIYIALAIKRVIEQRGNILPALAKFSFNVLISIVLIAAAFLPFMTWPVISTVTVYTAEGIQSSIVLTPALQQVIDSTVGRYPFVSLNAFNIYTLFGQNWAPIEDTFLNIGFGVWGVIALGAAAVLGFIMVWKNSEGRGIFYSSAFICAFVFTFSTRMHERYSFIILVLLLAAYSVNAGRKAIFTWAALSSVMFVNNFIVLQASQNNIFHIFTFSSRVFSTLWMMAFAYFAVEAFASLRKDADWSDFKPTPEKPFTALETDKNPAKFTRRDLVVMIALTVVYAAVAFFRLGDREAPETPWTPQLHESAVFDLGRHVTGAQMWLFNGARHNRFFTAELSDDGVGWSFINRNDEPMRFDSGCVFRWNNFFLRWDTPFRYVRVTSAAHNLMLMEIAFRDDMGEQLIVTGLTAGMDALLDEQHILPERATHLNGTFFDEIYHPRTAYEIIHGLEIFEISHPPLGKVIMSWGVRLFGMNPFGWRFMGTLVGVLMVPAIYLFAHFMFKSTFISFFAAFLFSFDFMHYVQTRLATIDSYVVLFIILQYLFMYKYYKTSFYNVPLGKTLPPLFFSGLFMGLGIASKWTGVYAGAGLAIIFAVIMWRRYREHRLGKPNFWKNFSVTSLCSFAFFVVIPLIIYIWSYVPQYQGYWNVRDFMTYVWNSQTTMFGYHSGLVAEHPYSSMWWEWPLMVVPMWYYSGRTAEGLREGISAFGNPAVWWGGIAAFFYTLYKYYKTKDKTALFLIIGYLAQLLPWIFVSRIVFIYHYFTAVPFIVLMLAYAAKDLQKVNKSRAMAINIGFLAAAALLFIIFFPVLSGMPVRFEFVDNYLRWMPTWVLV